MSRAVVAEPSALCHGIEKVLVEQGHQVALVDSAASAVKVLDPETTVVVLGRIGDMSCEDAVQQLRRTAPVSVIVLLAKPDRERLVALLSAGADGVLTATPTPAELRDSVLRVGKGERFVSPGLLAALFGENDADIDEDDRPPSVLTERERFVLQLAAEGRSNREIAGQLFISQATVKTHLQNIYAKLGVANRVQAVGRAIELRLLY